MNIMEMLIIYPIAPAKEYLTISSFSTSNPYLLDWFTSRTIQKANAKPPKMQQERKHKILPIMFLVLVFMTFEDYLIKCRDGSHSIRALVLSAVAVNEAVVEVHMPCDGRTALGRSPIGIFYELCCTLYERQSIIDFVMLA